MDSRQTIRTAYGNAEAFRVQWGRLLADAGRGLVEGLPSDARRVLDLGAGVGVDVPHIRRHLPAAHVVAADLIEPMIRLAPADAARLVMDAGALAFGDASFDAVVIAFMLFHVPDPRAALRGVRRALARGGTIAVGTWEAEPEDFRANVVWIEELDSAGALPADASVMNHEMMDTPGKVVALLGEAGFSDVRAATRSTDEAMDLETFLTRRTTLGTSRVRFESLPQAARAEVVQRTRERLASLSPEDFVSKESAIYAWARAS